ncbi:MAG TPA: hypothetical protein VMR62_31115 [Bryobacteraceae bacterium]|nr:hypothetical protein [Bryobacteraceae bacterium]
MDERAVKPGGEGASDGRGHSSGTALVGEGAPATYVESGGVATCAAGEEETWANRQCAHGAGLWWPFPECEEGEWHGGTLREMFSEQKPAHGILASTSASAHQTMTLACILLTDRIPWQGRI